jgi:diaminohydroxyphosphoribosylaminopyrimidine deaminase/5-amino-6-(5-phosphoribosylamino)uracil reductase
VPTLLETDHAHLTRAIELAASGRGRTSPNPLVGAVVVRGGEVLGEGFHTAHGAPHAERAALAACGDADTRGATLYVSLEPCCHYGLTPPCTDAILEAGIARVVVASDDPSEKASGRGLGILRDEGVEVTAHGWRAECDAVACGIGTALADDPQLTARIEGVSRQPRRVVFDSEARLPLDSRLVRGAADVPLTVVVSRAAPRTATSALEAAGADVLVATGENEPARVRSALTQLGAAGITAVLLEGGPHLAGAFLDAGEVDELRLFIAPVLVGGSSARDPLEGEGVDRIAEARRALTLESTRVGADVLLCARLREW